MEQLLGAGEGVLGYASEWLGFDDEISPVGRTRVMLFMSDTDLPMNRLSLVAASCLRLGCDRHGVEVWPLEHALDYY